jgi:hypothetical protein
MHTIKDEVMGRIQAMGPVYTARTTGYFRRRHNF